tara:strand:- start:2760 stop:3659 length:900 start_codon:yes stop_codon:yes gene_type:complete
MRRIIKKIIQVFLKVITYVAPKENMSSHLYRIRLYILDEFHKMIMQRVRMEAYKGHTLKFIVPNVLSDWRAQTFATKEPETLEWIDSMLEESVLWDVGANVGLYSLYAAKSLGVKVFAFEPSVFNLELLARNAYENKLQDKICIVPMALSDKTNFNSMHITTTDWGGALSTFGEAFGWDGKKINHNFQFKTIGITMDDAVAHLNLPLPNFIKMDVDGLEHLILLGGQKVLSQVESVLIEVNDNFIEQADGVNKILTNAGLKLVDKKRSLEEFSQDENIQAQDASQTREWAAFNQIWKRT